MPVAKKESDLRKIERADTNKKIELENKLVLPVKSFLRNINTDFYNQYLSDESVIDTLEYKPQLYALLLGMYGKISNISKNNIRESFSDKTSNIINAQIDNKISISSKRIADLRSNLILNTTNREIASELSNTITQLIIDEKPVDKIIVANEVKKSLNEKVEGRAKIITTSEVQTIAEDTKKIEENTLVENSVILGGIALATMLTDVWVSNLDERTREAHAIANGQEKSANEMFFIGGEFLEYPGDPNGSAGNIINCRCSKVSKIF